MSLEEICEKFKSNGYRRIAKNYWEKDIEMEDYSITMSITYILSKNPQYKFNLSVSVGSIPKTRCGELLSDNMTETTDEGIIKLITEFENNITGETFKKAIHTILKTMGKI